MALNMTKFWRWKSVKEQLESKLNVNAYFFDKYFGYIAAYRYICKFDKEVLHRENWNEFK